ncbi:YczE/YyaS/YitT family protein [Paenibacillus sp. MMS18-CY102]|uniref:YczE/YyaS/YitT family protein n=1 Tax=Paenibacillus sp. MMS18-CY102 TaxID=2682849 RepID=UPI0013664CDF|nr:permease [Paenibacillus sp. MMS18-CY102]MWC28625.1 permease [Paenibacillus sp. MMS18-CY102]
MSMMRRCLIYIVGLFILSLGVVCMIKADTGIAPWDALNVALTDNIGLTIGSWVFVVGGVIILVNSIIRMKLPNLAGGIPIIIIGFFVDLLNLKVLTFLKLDGALYQWGLFMVGLCILAVGISIYLRANLPSVPNDELMLAVTERTGWKIYITKTIGEAAALVLAVILKGPVGVGTVIVMVSIGVLINFFDKLLHKIGFSSTIAHATFNQEKSL